MTVLVSILLEVAGNVWADGGVISTFLNRMVNAAWYEDGEARWSYMRWFFHLYF